ncbi:formate dehydrogenase subunit gamma [Limibaculum sp. M0105]|uniref:Formate dehydrogenase subunit gamma n=1 Tax=Thermohalobaculum xanthum TaxID=2753746 RepID=A0A8J7M3P9_9RHOB|nr:formate dehydrogenase subunit gamma [Thermohalobaculum xanthum]MBK0397654.1 formate dehydrogenase subunit gamma [Thermohalobaculum xanthum]
MRARRRGTIVGASALALALAIFFFTALQMSVLIGEAGAQSSDPQLGANAETTEPGAGIIRSAGGSVRPPANAETNAPTEPGVARELDLVDEMSPAKAQTPLVILGPNSDASVWSAVRHGVEGQVSIPDAKAGQLIQSFGTTWEWLRSQDGPLFKWGGYALGGMVALLAVFYLLRGRIRIEHGPSGVMIERFKPIERFGHWLLAVSFILLALTGLNLLYGKELLLPLIGKDAFAAVAEAGKFVHNNVAWPFMLGLVLVFVLWVWHNIPSYIDLIWLAKGGGLFSKGVHPPSRKFNAGQKLIFWATILLGVSVSASGLSLLFPYELPLFAKTFQALHQIGITSLFGFELRTDLTAIEEMQYAQVWHTIVSLAMMVIIIAHIYIGSLGMEGAFDAMGTGMVDRNWAIEHHGLWVEEMEGRQGTGGSGAATTPAE